MVRIVSDFVLKSRLKKKLKFLTSFSKTKNKKIKSIVVLLSENHKVEEQLFLDFAKDFKVPTANITLVVFSEKKIAAQSTILGQRIECSRDMVNFWGDFPQDFNVFFEKEVDLLINFFDNNSLLPSYISAFCKAKLRLGFSTTNHALNDLILTVNPIETDLFISESTRYLKSILK
ncbi:MAG: hypothetical protein ACI9TK_000873 [Flavobacteriaceae bacterium]|jgi:hypothetical protein|tara:strand:- start:1905 stop:2429 length:525 start_codon:yes stop_codon:yes gene_type:complete